MYPTDQLLSCNFEINFRCDLKFRSCFSSLALFTIFNFFQDSFFCSNSISVSELSDVELLRTLIEKLNLCVSQMEQFAVRTHDLPSAPGR